MGTRLEILFEDDHCLAVVKPAGQFPLGTWAPADETTLEADVRVHLNPGDPGSAYVGIVHRLDRPTSGVVLWAKHPKAARRLSSQFEKRTVAKEYWAIAQPNNMARQGSLEPQWIDGITRAHVLGTAQVVPLGTPGAREAITLARFGAAIRIPDGLVWLVLEPKTGRTHQLRAQAAARGMPIVGDAAYGSVRPFLPAGAIALHARTLRARHPIEGSIITLHAPTPPAWKQQGIELPEAQA